MSDLFCMDIYSGKLYVGGGFWGQIDTFGLDRQCAAYELNNGRLAMIGILGMMAQELVTQQQLF